MAIQEVIKYEGENSVLIYKHPAEDFNTMSQLIVHESQEAVFLVTDRLWTASGQEDILLRQRISR